MDYRGDNRRVAAPILEIKRRLDGSEARFECQAVRVRPGQDAIVRYLIDRAWDVPGVALRPGMVTYGHFWIDRPYNVYHWLEGERTVAHYVNLGECDEIALDRIVWRDYAVDVLVTNDGGVRVLDEDELAGASQSVRAIVEATKLKILNDSARSLVGEVERATRRVLDTRRAP